MKANHRLAVLIIELELEPLLYKRDGSHTCTGGGVTVSRTSGGDLRENGLAMGCLKGGSGAAGSGRQCT